MALMFIYIYDDRQSPQGDKYRSIVRAPGRYANPSRAGKERKRLEWGEGKIKGRAALDDV